MANNNFHYLPILKEWNFWENKLNAGIYRQSYINKLLSWIDAPEIIALYGVRRGGKSTLLLQLIKTLHKKRGIPYKNFLFVNFEDPRLGGALTAEDLFAILDEYKKALLPQSRIYLLLDEVQQVKNWQKFVISIYEQKQNIKIIITGSSSQLLKNNLSSLLSGRLLTFPVFPLNFKEFLIFKKSLSFSRERKINLFDEYLQFGGFPRVVLEKDKQIKRDLLISYYETILEKDTILKNKIKQEIKLKSLARYIMSNVGNILSTYSLERTLGLSNVMINKYLTLMAEAFLIFRNNFFSFSVKRQIYNPSKIYVIDTGLANVGGFSFSENKGKFLENIVNLFFRAQNKEIYYWKNSSEVDFIVFFEKQIERAVNVTLTVDEPNVLARELQSLEAVKKELKLKKTELLTLYNQSQQNNPLIIDLIDYLILSS